MSDTGTTTVPVPAITQEDLNKLAADLTSQLGNALTALQDRVTALEAVSIHHDLVEISGLLAEFNAELEVQQKTTLIGLLNDLARTRGVGVLLD